MVLYMHSRLVYVILFVWCTAMTLLLAAAVWIGIIRIRAIEADAGHLPLQVAPIQLVVNIWWRFQKFNVQWDRWLRLQVTWKCWQIHLMESMTVWLKLEDLPSIANLLLFSDAICLLSEQGNHVAMNSVGHAQYMSAIRCFAWAGDDTNPPAAPATATASSIKNNGAWSGVVYGGGESEFERTEDHLLKPNRDLTTRQGEIKAFVDDLRLQLNVALAEENWSDAGEIQRTILMLLDHAHNQGMRDPEARLRVFSDDCRFLQNAGKPRRKKQHEQCNHSQAQKLRGCLPLQDLTAYFGQLPFFGLDARESEQLPVTIMLTLETQYAATIPRSYIPECIHVDFTCDSVKIQTSRLNRVSSLCNGHATVFPRWSAIRKLSHSSSAWWSFKSPCCHNFPHRHGTLTRFPKCSSIWKGWVSKALLCGVLRWSLQFCISLELYFAPEVQAKRCDCQLFLRTWATIHPPEIRI